MPQLASVGHGVWVGNYNVCDIFRKHFYDRSGNLALSPKVIHVWHPTQPGHCNNMVGHPSNEHSDNLVIAYREGDEVPEKTFKSIFDFAFTNSQVYAPLLIHCAMGIGRAPTLALICKIARQCNVFDAMGDITKGMWRDYETKVAPEFLSRPLKSIFEFIGEGIYDVPHVY